jgi:site-specific DNA-methyltransferase (adenine-specific)
MIQVKDEFKKLIPPLSAEEHTQLTLNICKEGIREPLILWNNYIIDGHNRFEIAKQFNLEYKTISKEFENEDEVKEWMILNQFGRRNLSAYQRSVLALELEDVFRIKAKEKQQEAGGAVRQKSDKAAIDTKKELSKVASVSHDTIAKVKKIQEKAPQEIKTKLSTGEISINAAYKEIKKKEKKENFLKNKIKFNTPILKKETNQNIIHGNCLNVLPTLSKNSFDLLLTDPPYGMDFKSGWNNKSKIKNDKIEDTILLFDEALKQTVNLLKEDAHFYIFGNINFLELIKPIIEKHLNLKNILIWDRGVIGMGDLKSYGNSFDIIYFGYNKKYKDLNGNRDRDILNFNRVTPSKNIHPTEKPIDILEYLIKKSTMENNKILDPFAGGGSTLLASKNTNRKCTGIELEEEYFDMINLKLQGELV